MPKKVKKTETIGTPTGRVFLGVDPGKNGGLVTITQGGVIVNYYSMPRTEHDLWGVISRMNGVHVAAIEKVHSMPFEGGKSSFTFGMTYGSIRMALVAAGIPFREVPPKEWQRFHKVPPRKKKGRVFTETKPQYKERLRAKAQQLFPSLGVWSETLGEQRAICDALLIADYVRRNESC